MLIENWTVYYFDEVISTNDVAKKLARNTDSKFISVADNQTSGKGQYGRNWESPPGKNLLSTFSVKNYEKIPFELISFLAGISVAETLAGFGITVNCKWPNDVLVNGSKIAGILIEKDESWFYIGIGLNILWPDPKIDFDKKKSWTSIIGESKLSINREIIIKKIADSFDCWCAKSNNEILKKYKSLWKDKNKNIKVNIDGNWLPGKLVSVLNNGGVNVELNNGGNIDIYSSAKLNYEC